ncbi:uncharacterized protein BX663DRAFT_507213 [Cokeromyces recurvatus]|uniref:uncharacterized protein n=1 Tax=Cokeromyces recurvatus TaxID=90255 RepID=UPI002220B3D6|nr:uncharacterized protein BX663DRAFT_507213 [Cokeromyces recurvatus]KAI7903651.1 hypothetical protein BX663DRAFT_507213 [Cokeromyces recurvatus]
MSFFFKKTKSEKTDASLDYQTIINDLNTVVESNTNLDIDYFIQKENIHLQHQEYYQEIKNEREISKYLKNDCEYTSEDARQYVNNLIKLSNSMPDMKAMIIENNDKVSKSILENKQSIDNIESTLQVL